MKKYLLLLIAVLPASAFCQNKIATTYGDTLTGYIHEVNTEAVKFYFDKKDRKIAANLVQSIYMDSLWQPLSALIEKNLEPSEPSLMVNDQLTDSPELSKKQLNHIYSAGVFLEKSGKSYTAGAVSLIVGTLLAGIFASDEPDIAVTCAVAGSVGFVILNLGGSSKMKQAASELKAFPYK